MRSLPQHRPVQGRRPSVAPTTARRRPFARRRPGVGILPAWHPAARVGAPAERFRVYAEDEYFAQGEQIAELARDGSAWRRGGSALPPDGATAGGTRRFRVAVGTMLFAGTGALGLVLAFGVLGPSNHMRRKAALRAARANARAVAAASAIAEARTSPLRRKRISRRARPVRAAAVAASSARHGHGRAHVKDRPRTQRSAVVTSRSTADDVLSSARLAGSDATPSGDRGTGNYVLDHKAAVAVPSESTSRPAKGEFGFER